MKYLIISDTHANQNFLELMHSENADIMLHLGDSQLPYHELQANNIYCVRGNCDYDFHFPSQMIINIGNLKALLIHGDKYLYAYDYDNLIDVAIDNNCQIVFFGHIHIPVVYYNKGVLCINPGSYIQDRGEYGNSYMILEKGILTLKKALDHSIIKSYDLTKDYGALFSQCQN